jgi:hypothetical protein
MLQHEGCGDHIAFTMCYQCSKGQADHRCNLCLSGGELLCASCIVAVHRQLPFHTIHVGFHLAARTSADIILKCWTGFFFERRTLKDMGLRIQLGHWHASDCACPLPQAAPGDDFVIVASSGVHPVHLDFCMRGRSGHPTVQLLHACLWQATTTNPRTATTFSVLRQYHLLLFESTVLEFYQSLARESDNLHYKKDKVMFRPAM